MPALPESLTLRDDGVVLRDWREEDAPSLEPVCGDWEVCQFTSVPWAYSPSEARAWVRRIQERRSSGTGLAMAITRECDDIVVGNVNLVRFSGDGREAALGYWLIPAARRQGLASRAARTLCSWAFHEMRLTRIELAILADNPASHGVAERLGAAREGTRRDSHPAGGRSWDMVIYSLRPAPRR